MSSPAVETSAARTLRAPRQRYEYRYAGIVTEVGDLWMAATPDGVRHCSIGGEPRFIDDLWADGAGSIRHDPDALAPWLAQIAEYFAGRRRVFDVPLDLSGHTPFSRQVMLATIAIPYGQVRGYGDVAADIGCPHGARAVGGALGACRTELLVPCHRVIHANGGPGGYGASLDRKLFLLQHEKEC